LGKGAPKLAFKLLTVNNKNGLKRIAMKNNGLGLGPGLAGRGRVNHPTQGPVVGHPRKTRIWYFPGHEKIIH
jgi:hypothetical protein